MNNAANKYTRRLVLALPFALALVYSSAFSASFASPKNAIFAGVAFALAAFALTYSSPSKLAKGEGFLWIAAAAYLGVNIVSAIRSQGYLIFFESISFPLCGVLLLVAARTAFYGEDSGLYLRNLQTAIAGAAALVALIAAAQFFGIHLPGAFTLYNSSNRMRIYATLGNPDFVAAFLAICLPAAIGLAGSARGGRKLWIMACVMISVAIVLTGSRGGVIAGAAGVTVATYLLMRKRWPVLIAVLVAFALLAGTQLNARTLRESLRGRIFIWQVSLDKEAARSALGSGPGSFAYNYPVRQGQFFSRPGRESLLHFAGRELHAQNDFVEAWQETGWLGLCALMMLLGSWFQVAIRRLRASDDAAKPATAVAIASVAALCAAALFDFPMHRAETWALLWLSMAVPLISATPPVTIGRRWATLRYAGAALLLAAGSYFAFAPLAASYEIAKGELDEDAERMESSQTAYRTALRWEPASPDANFDLTRALAKAGVYSGALAQSKVATRFVNEPELYILRSRILQNTGRKTDARSELEDAMRLFPYSMEVRGEIASLSLPGT